MSIKPIFAWYDFWIGLYLDRNGKRLYIFPIPMFGICIEYGPSPLRYVNGVTLRKIDGGKK